MLQVVVNENCTRIHLKRFEYDKVFLNLIIIDFIEYSNLHIAFMAIEVITTKREEA